MTMYELDKNGKYVQVNTGMKEEQRADMKMLSRSSTSKKKKKTGKHGTRGNKKLGYLNLKL